MNDEPKPSPQLSIVDGQISVDNSPLVEADPKSLDELFTRIDTSLKLNQVPTKEDIDSVVLALRRQRQRFLSEEAAKIPGVRTKASTGAKAPAKARSSKTVTSVKQALTIDDLF